MEGQTPKRENGQLKIYFLPNLLTAGNLFCGFVALTKIVEADLSHPLDRPGVGSVFQVNLLSGF